MNVLFIGKRFYTNRDAWREQYGRIYQLPRHWAREGIPTRLWLVDYHSRENVSHRDGELEVVSTPVRNLNVFRHWFQTMQKTGVPPDVVVASGDCYIGLMGCRIARRFHARFVFDVYDKYDEFSGYRRLPGFDPFQFLLRDADARLFASRALMEATHIDSGTDLLVPNGIDLLRFRPQEMRECRVQLELPAEVTCVGYFGSMTVDRGVDDLITAVGGLRDRGFNIELVLAGRRNDGVTWSQPWIHYLGNLPYDRVPLAMASCNLLALPYRHSDYLDMASSCKIAEYIAMNRSIAATDTPNFRVNFPRQAAQLGSLLAVPGEPADLARVIAAQLDEGRVVSLPEDIGWDRVAATASRQLMIDQRSAKGAS